jgi:hypothetical protein
MRSATLCLPVVFFAALALFVRAEEPAKTALESDPSGWTDLMPGKDLKGWKRVAIAPDEKLNARNPWSLSADGKTLVCDGVGVKEMFLHEQERGDGIFHVEWRFPPVKDGKGYNSGVYVRTSSDGKQWHQAQVAHQEKPPHCGDLFGETLVDGKPAKFQVLGGGSKLVKEPGGWNTYEVTCKGKTVTVRVNGGVATTWTECAVPRGHVGMQAEFFLIEFRNLKFKPSV